MTVTTVSHAKSDAMKSTESAWRRLVTGLRSLHEAHQQRRVVRELAAFSDRELADLGLTRGDIGAVASGALRR
jgi:uncharacterized protein YjiS (DUF1127 family)